MRVHYTPLITLECLHEYFADGRCRSLSLRPTAQCQRLLERYQCLFRPTPAGGVVAYASQDGVEALGLFDEQLPFSFELIAADPFLVNYTQAEPVTGTPAERLYYFSNLADRTAEVHGAARLLLHPPGEALTNPPLPVRPKRFSHAFTILPRDAQLDVVDTLRGEPVWQGRTPAGGMRAVPLNLSALPDGRYRLRVDGQEALDFYMTDAAAANRFGVVEIFPGGPAQTSHVPAACGVIDDTGQARPKTFSLCLNSRGTRWRYYIVNPPAEEHAYDGYRVEGTAKGALAGAETQAAQIAFSETEGAMVDGRPARVFVSDQPIPLYEKPGDAYQFIFKANGQGERGGRAFKLPYARGQNTRLEEVNGERRMCSEIFVYL